MVPQVQPQSKYQQSVCSSQYILCFFPGASSMSTQPVLTPTSPTTATETSRGTEGVADVPLWPVVGGSLGGVVAIATLTAVLVWLRRSRAKSANRSVYSYRQRGENHQLFNGRCYPNVPTSPNAADAANDTTSSLSIYNGAYDRSIPTTGNVAYACPMTTNVAYGARGDDHSVPQYTTTLDSGSYVVNQLVYEETEEEPQDMYMYDYITMTL